MTSSAAVLAKLERMGSKAGVAGMARYGIVTDTALGMSNAALR